LQPFSPGRLFGSYQRSHPLGCLPVHPFGHVAVAIQGGRAVPEPPWDARLTRAPASPRCAGRQGAE
jgi:hypothetical protein